MANEISISILAEVKKATASIQKFAKLAEKSFSEVEKASKGVNDSVKKIQGSFDGLKSVAKIGGIIAAGFAAFKGVSAVLGEAIAAANRFENAIRGVSSVAKSLGIDAGEVQKAVKDLASDGLIPLEKVADGLRNLLATGIGLDKSIELFNALKDSAVENRDSQVSLEDAVVSATEGFKKNRATLIQNALATADIDKFQRQYALSLGKTVQELTKQEKTQALLNGILKESAQFTGSAAKLSQTYEGTTSRLNAAFGELSEAVGRFITQNQTLIGLRSSFAGFIEGVAQGLETVRGAFNGNSESIRVFSSLLIAVGKSIEDTFGKILGTNLFSKLGEQLEAYADKLEFLAEDTEKLTDAQKKLNKELNANIDTEQIAQLSKSYEDLEKQIVKLTNSELQNLEQLKSERLKIVQEAVDAGAKAEKDAQRVRILIEQDYQKSVKSLRDKEQKEFNDRLKQQAEAAKRISEDLRNLQQSALSQITQAGQNPLDVLFNFQGDTSEFERSFAQLTSEYDAQNISLERYKEGLSQITDEYDRFLNGRFVNAVGGTLSLVAQGAEGARQLVTGIAKGAANAIVPGLGDALGPLFDAFTKGPEEVKKLVQEFFKAIPIIIQAFVESIPVFIEELINAIPQLIDSLVQKLPQLIEGLIAKLPDLIQAIVTQLPLIAIKLATELGTKVPVAIIKNIPSIIEALIRGLRDGLIQIFNDIIDSITGFVSDPLGSIGDFFGFAQGGQGFVKTVPSGFGNDSFPARLTSGELVVDRSTAFALKDFLAREQSSSPSSDVSSAEILLGKILNVLENGQVINGEITVSYDTLSKAILKLDRTNQRIFSNQAQSALSRAV